MPSFQLSKLPKIWLVGIVSRGSQRKWSRWAPTWHFWPQYLWHSSNTCGFTKKMNPIHTNAEFNIFQYISCFEPNLMDEGLQTWHVLMCQHYSKGKIEYPWERPPIHGLYNGCIGHGVMLGEQLLGYSPKGTWRSPCPGPVTSQALVIIHHILKVIYNRPQYVENNITNIYHIILLNINILYHVVW